MVEIKRQYKINKLAFPVDGNNFDVQVFLSTDGGKNYYFCGIGKHCKTQKEAEKYIEEYEKKIQ